MDPLVITMAAIPASAETPPIQLSISSPPASWTFPAMSDTRSPMEGGGDKALSIMLQPATKQSSKIEMGLIFIGLEDIRICEAVLDILTVRGILLITRILHSRSQFSGRSEGSAGS